MKKAHLSQQEMIEMFNLIPFGKLLYNAKKAIDKFDEDPIKQLRYIFGVLTNYFEKVKKNLEAYKSVQERVSLSNPYQHKLFTTFCDAVGVIDSEKIGSEKFEEAKKIYKQLFEMNAGMLQAINSKDFKANAEDFLKIKEMVDKAYDLINQYYSKDKKLEDAEFLVKAWFLCFLVKENVGIRLMEKKVNEINEKTGKLVVRLYNKEKAQFYDIQINCCLNIIGNIYKVSCMSEMLREQRDDDFLIAKHLIDLTVELMAKYYDEMKKEYASQFYFLGEREFPREIDEKETDYLKQVDNFFEKMKEKPHLGDLPAFAVYTDAFNRFFDMMNVSELSGKMSAARLSPR